MPVLQLLGCLVSSVPDHDCREVRPLHFALSSKRVDQALVYLPVGETQIDSDVKVSLCNCSIRRAQWLREQVTCTALITPSLQEHIGPQQPNYNSARLCCTK